MIKVKHHGNFRNIENLLKGFEPSKYLHILEKYGEEGVIALSSATPTDSGATANSWNYEIVRTSKGYNIRWNNSNIVDGVPIAILIQYGHGTKNGGYVQGRDYINPALRPIFDRMAEELWREVIKR